MLAALAACGGSDDVQPTTDAAPCTDTHDEDGDGVGDRCDICPAAPDPLQRDTTERATMLAFPDGVGDACDPRAGLSGDVLAAFHPFVDPASAAGWNGSGWTIADDGAHATTDARWIHRTPEQGDGLFVQARIAQLALGAGGRFDLVVGGNGVEAGYTCSIAGTDQLVVRELGGATMMTTTSQPITGAITLTAWRLINPQRTGEVECRVQFDGGMARVALATSDDIAIGLYGFAQTAATTDVNSLVVYTSPTLPEQDP